MWDCKHRISSEDFCHKRKTKCFPGGAGCVLKGKYEMPFRDKEDPLLSKKKSGKIITKK